MRYCPYCKRLNPGRPLFCQYCGRTFGARVCSKCGYANPKEALVCRNCGSSELSDISGDIPLWLIILKGLFWLFGLLLVAGLLRNLELLVPLVLFIGFILIGYSFLPEGIKKIIRFFFNLLKQRLWGKKEKS